jgi:GNAT superfamily N-acetyltransferase
MMVRKATSADLPAILDLVHELAIFEKEPEAVFTTLEEYTVSFEQKIFDAAVAEKEGHVVAMALWYPIFSTWKGRVLYLEDLIVKESERGAGIGQLLFDAFINEAKAQKCRMVKWQVLDWNTNAIRFYEKNHAEIDTTWYNGYIRFY